MQGSRGLLGICDLLKFELAPIPLAMFKENGAMKTATSKCALKNALAKPRLSHQKADILIVDASAQLWFTAWPGKGGLVSDLINTFRQFIARQLDLKQDVLTLAYFGPICPGMDQVMMSQHHCLVALYVG